MQIDEGNVTEKGGRLDTVLYSHNRGEGCKLTRVM